MNSDALSALDDLNQKFGCIMFDLTEDQNGKFIPHPGAGWASINGGSPYRIKNEQDLSSDVIWLSNLSQEVLWKSGAVRLAHLKHQGYLTTDVGQIMKELGLNPPQTPIADACEKISDLFSKVMSLAREFYGVRSFLHKELPLEIKQALHIEDRNISMVMDEALTRAYQNMVICDTDPLEEKWYAVSLKLPRYFHAKNILETTIPLFAGDWEFIPQSELPGGGDQAFKFLMELKRPFIAKVSIKQFIDAENLNIDPSKILHMGEALGEGGKTKDRNWASQPEILYLSRFASLNIEAAFVSDGYQNIKGIDLPFLGEMTDLSYSCGLLAENLITALSSRSINPKTKTKTLVSPRACWLKAADRFATMKASMILSCAGFRVLSYGNGAVNIAIRDEEIFRLIDIAPHAGVTIPANLTKKCYH